MQTMFRGNTFLKEKTDGPGGLMPSASSVVAPAMAVLLALAGCMTPEKAERDNYFQII